MMQPTDMLIASINSPMLRPPAGLPVRETSHVTGAVKGRAELPHISRCLHYNMHALWMDGVVF